MKIELTPSKIEHAAMLLEWRGQPSWIDYNPLKPLDLKGVRDMLSMEGSDFSDLNRFENFRWFISIDGEVVGHVLLKNINHMMDCGEIGYGISEAYQGKGIASASVKIFVRKIFQESNLRKLIAYVHEANSASCKILERIGFKREGLLREHHIINDVATNQVLFGLLKRELKHD